MYNVYVIVVTYNGSKWINKCLNSLTASSIPTRIIVVDNASKDGTPNLIRNQFPGVEILQAQGNLGFGKGNNIGLRKALHENADYVFLLNQDAWVEPDSIQTLITTHEDNPTYGILSPVHLNGSGDALDYMFSHWMTPSKTPSFYSDLFVNKLQPIYKTEYVNAASWLIPRTCIETVGGFDPIFPQYGEDDDYINRVVHHGFSVGIVTGAKIYHDRKDRRSCVLDPSRLFVEEVVQLKSPQGLFRNRIFVFLKRMFSQLIGDVAWGSFS